MEIYVKLSISIFSPFFQIRCVPVSQLQTQQVITSQIRSYIEYLIDLLYSCAHFSQN